MPLRRCLPVIALALAACGAAPAEVATRLDPRAADYAGLRVFLTLPEGQAPAPGFPVLTLRVQQEARAARTGTARLVRVPDPRGPGAYAVAREDLAGLAALSEAVVNADGSGSAAVSIGVETCRMGPAGGGALTVALAAPDDPRPLPLLRAGDAPGAAPGAAVIADLDAKAPCP
ncbi:hypothetical protein [Jannaschia aquimarina]|uniref:Lipoprotein n=1 Tax=Jannaschia aquimarina TaxID=935700 RepID=A0A0D1EQP6_9RHOB|nr:hypothetical protein [Jannaschia aquimarina]KIT17960.1 hypothetical protein jaqu_03170 [Jannaschia aquimarina]SNT07982.1 hypothetical protein SAMN05421775_105156 [Jannaschia aquimarina]